MGKRIKLKKCWKTFPHSMQCCPYAHSVQGMRTVAENLTRTSSEYKSKFRYLLLVLFCTYWFSATLCRQYQRSRCIFGAKCRHAHGSHELRSTQIELCGNVIIQYCLLLIYSNFLVCREFHGGSFKGVPSNWNVSFSHIPEPWLGAFQVLRCGKWSCYVPLQVHVSLSSFFD